MKFESLLDISQTHSAAISAIGRGNVFGAVAEELAAALTGSRRENQVGRDLWRPAPEDWTRPAQLQGIVGHGSGNPPTRESYAAQAFSASEKSRYELWIDDHRQLGEVKSRQIDRTKGPDQLLDTRGVGPASSYFPFVDYFVVIIFGVTGDVLMARELTREEMVDYVMANVGRNPWNYKGAISLNMTTGNDLTSKAQEVMRRQWPFR